MVVEVRPGETTVTTGTTTVIVRGGKPAGPPHEDGWMAPAEWPSHWKLFSPTEQALLAVMKDDYVSTADLARVAGVPYDSDLQPILRNLCARGILESAQGRGFRWRKASVEDGAAKEGGAAEPPHNS